MFSGRKKLQQSHPPKLCVIHNPLRNSSLFHDVRKQTICIQFLWDAGNYWYWNRSVFWQELLETWSFNQMSVTVASRHQGNIPEDSNLQSQPFHILRRPTAQVFTAGYNLPSHDLHYTCWTPAILKCSQLRSIINFRGSNLNIKRLRKLKDFLKLTRAVAQLFEEGRMFDSR